MLADDLLGAVTLDALRTRVPRHDVAVSIQQVDGVIAHALHDGAQLHITLADSLDRRSLLRGIAHKAQRHHPLDGVHRLEHDVDWKLGAVFAETVEIQRRPHLPRPRVRIVVFAMAGMAAPEPIRNQLLHMHSGEFYARVPEQLRRPRVRVTDPPLGIYNEDRIGRKLEEVLQCQIRNLR